MCATFSSARASVPGRTARGLWTQASDSPSSIRATAPSPASRASQSCGGARACRVARQRVDAVSSRLESAIKMQQVTKSMGNVVKGMDKVLGSMNVEAITKVMDQFEKSFEDMDVRSEYVEGAMNSSTTAAMPEEQVDELMQMVADEHGLKMGEIFKSAPGVSAGAGANAAAAAAAPSAALASSGGGGGGGGGALSGSAEDDLEERLRKLRAS